MSKLFLMLKDTVVMTFEREIAFIDIHRPELMPYELRDVLHKWEDMGNGRFVEDVAKDVYENTCAIVNWLSKRLSRYVYLYPYLNKGVWTASVDIDELVRLTHAVSPDDYYSVVDNTGMETFNPGIETIYNYIRRNARTYGKDMYMNLARVLRVHENAPIHYEMVQGKMSKVYPAGAFDRLLCTSRLFDLLGVRHLSYARYTAKGEKYIYRKTLIMTDRMFVPAYSYYAYCRNVGKDFIKECTNIDKDAFNKMIISDYLTGFSKRKGNTWGFMMDINTGDIVEFCPLFGLDNCFYNNNNTTSETVSTVIPSITMQEAAKQAVKKIKYKLPYNVGENNFMRKYDYDLFMKRADEIGCL